MLPRLSVLSLCSLESLLFLALGEPGGASKSLMSRINLFRGDTKAPSLSSLILSRKLWLFGPISILTL